MGDLKDSYRSQVVSRGRNNPSYSLPEMFLPTTKYNLETVTKRMLDAIRPLVLNKNRFTGQYKPMTFRSFTC